MTDTIVTADRLRDALRRAETFANEYEFDSDEGCHTPNGVERMLMLDMLNGLFDDEEFVEALALHGVPHFDRTRCATEGCGEVATEYFERGDVGSYHCADCSTKIEALALRTPSEGDGLPKYRRLDATGDRAYVEHPAGGVVHWGDYKHLMDHLLPYKAELLKIAEQVGEANDPFAAWESVHALAPSPQPVAEAVAWSYELATRISHFTDEPPSYHDFELRIGFDKPDVPEGAVRNLTPLFTSPQPEGLGIKVKALEATEESEAVACLREMVRLADMGFEQSLLEPEENGNFAVYERAKRFLSSLQPKE